MSGELEVLAGKAAELACVAAGRPEGERGARVAERLAARRFLISVAGEFKRGKSTLINALLGADVLPMGVLPMTAVATELSYGDPAAVVEYLDGHRELFDIATIADFVTETRNPGNERGVARVEVRGRWPLLEPGVVLVDTPGFGSVYEHNTETARAALVDADGAVLVLSADAPISEQERDLLRNLAARKAPTFFVLNKADHLRPAELDEVRRFVEQVLSDELGLKPALFPISARTALQQQLDGGVSEPGPDEGFGAFGAELERFIQQDLVRARLVAARGELARLGSSLRAALVVERAALELDAATLAAKVDEFRAAAATQRRTFDDDRTLLERDVARLAARIGDDLAAAARAAPEEHRTRLADLAATAPRGALDARLREAIESAVRSSFEAFRAGEAGRTEEAWQQLAAGFRSRTQARVDAVRQAAGELFAVSLPPLLVPAVSEERQQFFYLFLHVGSLSEPLASAMSRLVPSRVARRRAARWAFDELAREFDKHAGRARWDLTQRLDAVRRRFEASMKGELDAAVDAITDAARRAEELHRAADDKRHRRAADVRDEEALAVALVALGEDR